MFVKVADDFHVVPKVMQEGFDRKARACGFGSTLCAQQGYEADLPPQSKVLEAN